MTGLPICPSCQNSVSERRKGLKCDGMCKRMYHTSCIRWSSEEYQSYVTISNKIKWFCPACVNSLERVFVPESTFDFTSNRNKNSLRNGNTTGKDKVCPFPLEMDLNKRKGKSTDNLDYINNDKDCVYQKAKVKPKIEEQHENRITRDIINQREVRSKPMTPSSLDFYQKTANIYDNEAGLTNHIQLTPPLWQYQKPIYSNHNHTSNKQNSYTDEITKMQSKSEKPNTSNKLFDTNANHNNDIEKSDEIWKKSINKLHALTFLSRGKRNKTKKATILERKLNKKDVENSKEKELGLQHLTTDSGESLILHITYMRKKDKHKKSMNSSITKKNKHMKEKVKIKEPKRGIHLDGDGPTNMKNEKMIKHISTDSGESFLLHTIKNKKQGDEFVESIEFLEETEMDKEQSPLNNSPEQDNLLQALHNKKMLHRKQTCVVKCASPIISCESLEKVFSQTCLNSKQTKNSEGPKANSQEALDASIVQNISENMNSAEINQWGGNLENIETILHQKQLNEMCLFSDRNISLLKAVKDYTETIHLLQDGNVFPSNKKPTDEDIVEELIENISHTLETMNQNENLRNLEMEGCSPLIKSNSTQSYITQFQCFNNYGNEECTTNEMEIVNDALLRKTNSDKPSHDQYRFEDLKSNVENSKLEKNELNREISKGKRQNKVDEDISFQHISVQEGKDISKSISSILSYLSEKCEPPSKNKVASKINNHKDKIANEHKTHLNYSSNAKINKPTKIKIDPVENKKPSENTCKKMSKQQNVTDLGYLESAIGIISNMLYHKMKKQDEETQVDLSEWTSFENALTQTCTFKIPCSTIAINTSCSMSTLKDEVCQCPEIGLQENTGKTKIQELKNAFLKLEQFSRKSKPDINKSNLDKVFKHTVTFSDTPNISKELKQHKVQEWLFTAKQDQLNKPKQVKPSNIFKEANHKTLLENKFIFEGMLHGQPLNEEAMAKSSHVS